MHTMLWVSFNRVRILLAFFVLLALAAPLISEAQVSVYGTVAATNHGYTFNSGSLSNGGDHFGFGAGGFYNFPIQSRLTAGVDVRGGISPGSTGGASGAVSFRVGFVPHRNLLRPYFQIGGGFVTSKVFSYGGSSQTLTAGSVDLALGLDVRMTRSFDLRLVELDGAAGRSGSTGAGVGSISTGIVYHFL